MDDSAKNQSEIKELLAQVRALENDLIEIERSRKRQALIARIGILIMLAAVLLFTWNFWNFSKSLMSKQSLDKFGKKLSGDFQDLMRDPEVVQIQENIVKKVLPDLTDQVLDRFKKELPAFRAKGDMALKNISSFLEGTIKDELELALADSMEQIENEIHKSYPKVAPDKLDAALKAAEDVFVEHVATTVEKRLEAVCNDLVKMDSTVEKFSQLQEMREIEKMKPDDVKLQMIESFLELCIYELNPAKGGKPAGMIGGAK